MYLHRIEYFGMIDTDRRNWISGVLCAWNVKDSILPVTRLGFSISKCVHSKSLPSALMPSSFITMAICKTICSKPMHLVRKVFTSIGIPISN